MIVKGSLCTTLQQPLTCVTVPPVIQEDTLPITDNARAHCKIFPAVSNMFSFSYRLIYALLKRFEEKQFKSIFTALTPGGKRNDLTTKIKVQ